MRPSRSMWTTIAGVLVAAAVAIPGAAAQSPVPSAPTEFTMTIVFGDQVRQGTAQTVEGVTMRRGFGSNPLLFETSDPRLDGRVTIAFDSNAYVGVDGGTEYGTATWRIVDADGAWQGTYPIVITDEYASVATVALAGEGAYEGLTAVWEQPPPTNAGRWDIRGVIFPTPPLAAPVAAP